MRKIDSRGPRQVLARLARLFPRPPSGKRDLRFAVFDRPGDLPRLDVQDFDLGGVGVHLRDDAGAPSPDGEHLERSKREK